MIKHGANIGAVNNKGETPLHLAPIYNTRAVEVFIENGADVNVVDNDGWTPLHVTVVDGNSQSWNSE